MRTRPLSPFSALPLAPIDPIFGIAQAAKAAGEGTIDLSIGVALDEAGNPLLFPSVRASIEEWSKNLSQRHCGYPPLLGLPEFRHSVTELVFGNTNRHIASIAAAGGTGSIAVLLRLVKLLGITDVLLPSPSWPNHRRLIRGAGLTVVDTQYIVEGRASIVPTITMLKRQKRPVCVLLQACCHNPTGLDLGEDDWKQLAKALKGTPHIVLLDLAYQGLGRGIEADAVPARILAEAKIPLLTAWSATKNFGLYAWRGGLAMAVVKSEKEREKVEGHFRLLIRELTSPAPSPAQEIVMRTLAKRRKAWERDVSALRTRLTGARRHLRKALPQYQEALRGFGLFALLPFPKTSIQVLREKKVFLTDDGRINLGGITKRNLQRILAIFKKI